MEKEGSTRPWLTGIPKPVQSVVEGSCLLSFYVFFLATKEDSGFYNICDSQGLLDMTSTIRVTGNEKLWISVLTD